MDIKRRMMVCAAMLALQLTMMAQSTVRQFQIAPTDGQPPVMHVYLPAADKSTGRAVVGCPGGGYGHLSMKYEGTDWVEFFNSRGIAYMVLEYRLPNGDYRLPVADAERAIQTVRDSAAAWHVNPYDVGIMGFSAGGHLASTVSTHAAFEARPDFSILFYPVITMGKSGQHEGSCKNFLGEARDDEQAIKLFSNDRQVRRHLTPPAVILLANDDRGVPPLSNGIAYYSAMRREGNDCALFVYPRGGHGFGYRETFAFRDQMLDDLSGWLEHHKAPRQDAVRVACIGNSITDGHGIDMCDSHAYPAQLQALLGEGYHVRNFGVSARCVLQKSDYPFTNELAWRDALAFNPDIVVLKLGTNDSKDYNWVHRAEFATDYQSILDQLKALPSRPRVILAHPLKAFKDTWTINDSVIVNGIIPIIDRLAKENKMEVVDLHSAIDEMNKMLADGIHPNEKGDAVIAQKVYEAINTPRPSRKKSK